MQRPASWKVVDGYKGPLMLSFVTFVLTLATNRTVTIPIAMFLTVLGILIVVLLALTLRAVVKPARLYSIFGRYSGVPFGAPAGR